MSVSAFTRVHERGLKHTKKKKEQNCICRGFPNPLYSLVIFCIASGASLGFLGSWVIL